MRCAIGAVGCSFRLDHYVLSKFPSHLNVKPSVYTFSAPHPHTRSTFRAARLPGYEGSADQFKTVMWEEIMASAYQLGRAAAAKEAAAIAYANMHTRGASASPHY